MTRQRFSTSKVLQYAKYFIPPQIVAAMKQKKDEKNIEFNFSTKQFLTLIVVGHSTESVDRRCSLIERYCDQKNFFFLDRWVICKKTLLLCLKLSHSTLVLFNYCSV